MLDSPKLKAGEMDYHITGQGKVYNRCHGEEVYTGTADHSQNNDAAYNGTVAVKYVAVQLGDVVYYLVSLVPVINALLHQK